MTRSEVAFEAIPDDALPTARLFSTLEGFDTKKRGVLWGGLMQQDQDLTVLSIDRNESAELRITVDTSRSRRSYELLALGDRVVGVDMRTIPDINGSVEYFSSSVLEWRTPYLACNLLDDPRTQVPWYRVGDLDPRVFGGPNPVADLADLSESLQQAIPLPELIS